MSVVPSFHLSFYLSGCFLGIVSSIFSKFWHSTKNPYEVVGDRARFFWKNFFAQKIMKNDQKWPKNKFFEFIEIFGHWFLLNLFYNENLYYLLCFCTNRIIREIFVPEIWTKMCSANQIAGFFNWAYLQNKSMK